MSVQVVATVATRRSIATVEVSATAADERSALAVLIRQLPPSCQIIGHTVSTPGDTHGPSQPISQTRF